jgi:tRNA-splicing ligase RtcB
MNLAGRYAYAGREWVARKVVELLGGNEIDMVHNHHNFAWKENHWVDIEGQSELMELVVVRKGATPAFPNQKGFIGGSMGDDAVIVRGASPAVDSPIERQEADAELQVQSLFSTVHGAGRVMSRTAAAGKRKRNGKQISRGLVTHKMLHEWIDERGVILKGAGLDEAPHAYRRLPEVLSAQGGTIAVEETLRPVIVCMAGDDVRDPYKD